ncbi:Homogentisate 1,2-dioxygenase [Aspergillus stella-maris]|uniref:Homogentisate 1,2-dioxygenase n=1 Tax=Aspergillus stella-maris TaxID=1810926 RepID=UPI003CCDA890
MATATSSFISTPTKDDPYIYQTGFGNRFASEAIPGTLPIACNTPQRCKYDLVSEQLNGTPFVSSRASIQHAWFYRVRPSVVHGTLSRLPSTPDLEADFNLSNGNVTFTPQDMGWDAFSIPSTSEYIDFTQSWKTIGGHGDPSVKEGLAVHIYAANTSMEKKAFVNNDGDILILPQEGRLDIQTEYGKMMVRPGELVVIQAGMRFKVTLPDGVGRGYIQEIFGSHYELPELGPIGSNGMAMPRDFEIPVASFDIDVDKGEWEIVVKLMGNLWTYTQKHTPFDVVAWHGTYAPYKYCLEKFINASTTARDQSDPSIYCVLTAKSKRPGVSLAEFLVFTPKWNATTNTFRPPYYHRNVATELMGMIYGVWGGSGTNLTPGGLTFEPSYMPHGESFERWKEATSADLQPTFVGEGAMAFMMHISGHVGLTSWALERSGSLQGQQEGFWDGWSGGFVDRLDEVDGALKDAGLKGLERAGQ